jgi:hypothetical protein
MRGPGFLPDKIEIEWMFKEKGVILCKDKWFVNLIEPSIKSIKMRESDSGDWDLAGRPPAVIPFEWFVKYEPEMYNCKATLSNSSFTWYYKDFGWPGENKQSGKYDSPPKGAWKTQDKWVGDWEVWFKAEIDGVIIESPTRRVIVVKIEKMQYRDPDRGFTDITSVLYVHTGTTVEFKAITNPINAPWPKEKPKWGGTTGASGTGPTIEVTFGTLSTNTSDYKTVTAECGNTVTANVVVFEFEERLIPRDPFAGRSLVRYGLEEEVDLDFRTNPVGITALSIGGLRWTLHRGRGSVTNAGNDGNADYDARHIAGGAQLRLTIRSGPSKDRFKLRNISVISPAGTRMTRATGNVWHINGTASAGIALFYWITPTDVSFRELSFGEGTCPAIGATGIYTHTVGAHDENTFGAILGGNLLNGCRVSARDGARTLYQDWDDGGTFSWRIPTQYIDDTSTRNTFGFQIHNPTIQPNGTTTMRKGGQSVTAAVNDPTSGW